MWKGYEVYYVKSRTTYLGLGKEKPKPPGKYNVLLSALLIPSNGLEAVIL